MGFFLVKHIFYVKIYSIFVYLLIVSDFKYHKKGSLYPTFKYRVSHIKEIKWSTITIRKMLIATILRITGYVIRWCNDVGSDLPWSFLWMEKCVHKHLWTIVWLCRHLRVNYVRTYIELLSKEEIWKDMVTHDWMRFVNNNNSSTAI